MELRQPSSLVVVVIAIALAVSNVNLGLIIVWSAKG